jgi:glycosyltransferase involved in cell wall biosynthesis
MCKNSNIVIFMPSIEGGGVEKNLFLITNFLSLKFKKLTLITCSSNIKNFNKKIKIINFNNNLEKINFRFLKIIISSLVLFMYLLKNKNVVVLSFQANIFAILIGFLLGRKVVVRLNSSPSGWLKNDFKRMLFKKIYSLADLIIVNSFEFKKELKNKLNINSFCIYNPLNHNEIIQKSKIKIKNKLYKNKNSIKMINVGRLVDQKDHITLLKSINSLKKKIKIELIIMGRGYNKNKIENYIHNNSLKNNVKILSFKKNPYPYIKYSDVFVLSSIYEGLPNVLLEAIVLKKFIISSDCPTGPKEILKNGKGGLLFKTGSHKNLSEQILKYSKNKNNKKKIKFAYNSLRKFDFKRNLNLYYEKINEIILI